MIDYNENPDSTVNFRGVVAAWMLVALIFVVVVAATGF